MCNKAEAKSNWVTCSRSHNTFVESANEVADTTSARSKRTYAFKYSAGRMGCHTN